MKKGSVQVEEFEICEELVAYVETYGKETTVQIREFEYLTKGQCKKLAAWLLKAAELCAEDDPEEE